MRCLKKVENSSTEVIHAQHPNHIQFLKLPGNEEFCTDYWLLSNSMWNSLSEFVSHDWKVTHTLTHKKKKKEEEERKLNFFLI